MLPRPMRAGFRPAVQPRRVSRAVAGGLASFSTDFPTDENPVSVGGNFTSINTVLTRCKVVSGNVVSAHTAMINYEDAYALKTGTWSADQEAEAILYKAGGYSPVDNHEVELLLRGTEAAADSRTWYEFLWNKDGNMSWVHLTGASDGFTDLGNDFYAGDLVPTDGMVARARVTGQGSSILLEAYVNDVLRISKTVTNALYQIAGGRPGFAFFHRTGATPENLGWKSWTCRELA